MKTLLAIDDEPHMLHLLAFTLRKTGCRVLTAINGEEALALAARETPDLVLADLMLPGIDGFEVAARLRRQPGAEALPVIVLTARGHSDVRRDAEAAGVLLMTKPFSPLDLRLRVSTLLGLPTEAAV